jgi:nitroreductase/GNAT superfamily N-acetyltransferase
MADICPVIASPWDADEVLALVVRCRDAMEGTGMEQWPDFYPALDVVTGDIERRVLWILREEGEVVAAVTIDDIQPGPYASIEWRYSEPCICVHRLAVDPSRQREGLAGKMMAFAEQLAARDGCRSVRLDTYGLNDAANSFYGKIGYEKRGTIHLPKKPDEYNCFEKALQPEMLRELVAKSRSVRRFRGDEPVSRKSLEGLVALARLSPSGANRQPLKFLLSSDADRNALIFPHLKWAGYIKDWDGPAEGERPGGYIVILGDTEISKNFGIDHGIAAQSIMLGAAAGGLGGCMIGSIDRGALAEALGLSERYEILLVLAMGYPAEEIVVEDVTDETDIKYWRSADGVHHVPKRSMADLIIEQ